MYIKYKEVFDNFNMNYDHFVGFCDKIILDIIAKNEGKHNLLRDDMEAGFEEEIEKDEMFELIMNNLNNEEVGLYENKPILVKLFVINLKG